LSRVIGPQVPSYATLQLASAQPTQEEVTKKGKMDSKSEHAEMYSKNERNLMDLDDDTHREDQFSSSYETPTVTATHKEPTGMRPKFFEESILKQRREIERLQELLAAREQQLNEQGSLIEKMKAPFEPAPVTDPTLTPRVPRPQDIAYVETMRRQKRKKRQCTHCRLHRQLKKQFQKT
jgi:hypothetical protein